jgi:hypothetical protein
LTNKFARRFVMGGSVIIRMRDPYVGSEAPTCERRTRSTGRLMMRKTILTILGSALLTASVVQVATAAEQKGRKADRAPAPVSEPFRNSNAYAWPAPTVEPDWSRYQGGFSAPAGR